MLTDLALYRSARKDDFEGGVIVDGLPAAGVLYPSFEDKSIRKLRSGKEVTEIRPADIRPYDFDGKRVVDPGGGTSLWDRANVFGTKDWWNFVIPQGTVIPDSLRIRKGHHVGRFQATHYQIEPAVGRLELDAYKGALDNLARNAVVKLYEDARR